MMGNSKFDDLSLDIDSRIEYIDNSFPGATYGKLMCDVVTKDGRRVVKFAKWDSDSHKEIDAIRKIKKFLALNT